MNISSAGQQPPYLSLGTARDLPEGRERNFYRFLEIIPGALTWGTFLAVVLLAKFAPLAASMFILAFAVFWILKVVYLALHTHAAYEKMQEEQLKDWMQELEKLDVHNYSICRQSLQQKTDVDIEPWGAFAPVKMLKPHLDSVSSYALPVPSWKNIWQVIILPTATEPYEVVRPAVEAIAKSRWDKERAIVVLSVEEKAGEKGRDVARRITEEFKAHFPHFLVTFHPAGREGDIPGKGANERWGGLRAKELVDGLRIPYEHILVSSLDSDTVVHRDYFACLTYHYLTAENPLRTSYQPIAAFLNNIWEAPAISRILAFSSTFYHAMDQERPEKHRTFSSHSMPFKALVDLGFWQPNVVSEDSRIFWQAFFCYNGDYKVESLYYPVLMDANAAPTLWRTIKNLYKQQRRWAYGAENTPYALFAYWKKRKEVPFRKFLQYAIPSITGHYSWATNAVLLFVCGWLPILLGGDAFNATVFSYNLPRIVRVLMTIAMVGLVSAAYWSIRLLPPRPPEYGRSKYAVMILQWFLVIFTFIFLGSFPAIEAQTRLMTGKYLGFWITEKYRKR